MTGTTELSTGEQPKEGSIHGQGNKVVGKTVIVLPT